MKLGIISDTHNLLRPEVLSAVTGVDVILHAGDISSQNVIDQLQAIAPVKVVRGNADKDWAEHLPLFLDFEIDGFHIYMTHKKKDLPKDLGEYDLVITGHSHQYSAARQGGTVMLNPGSCGPRRFTQPITFALAETESNEIRITKIDIPHAASGENSDSSSANGKKM